MKRVGVVGILLKKGLDVRLKRNAVIRLKTGVVLKGVVRVKQSVLACVCTRGLCNKGYLAAVVDTCRLPWLLDDLTGLMKKKKKKNRKKVYC